MKEFKNYFKPHSFKKYDIVVLGFYESANIVVRVEGFEVTMVQCPPKMNWFRRKVWFFFLRLKYGWKLN